jgi:hypothetical protein
VRAPVIAGLVRLGRLQEVLLERVGDGASVSGIA